MPCVRLGRKVKDQFWPPHHQIFHSFVAALAELDVGGAVRKVLQEWLQKLEDAGAAAPKSIELVCQTFQCFPVRADAQRIRLQFALAQGPIRVAILNALDAAGLSVSTGPAPRTFLEEELADWISCLSLDD